jgi:death-on-curing protein
MPEATYSGEDLHPSLYEKAAAYAFHLVKNHPFVDGNKRVGVHAALLFAEVNGFECLATPDEVVEVTLTVARGDLQVEALAIWFRQRLREAAL